MQQVKGASLLMFLARKTMTLVFSSDQNLIKWSGIMVQNTLYQFCFVFNDNKLHHPGSDSSPSPHRREKGPSLTSSSFSILKETDITGNKAPVMS